MGFLSFNEQFYQRKLARYENRSLSKAEIYDVKQILKVLDDLADEGYTFLNERMEADFACLTRLRAILQRSGASPFPLDHERLSDTIYGNEEYELNELLTSLIKEAGEHRNTSVNPFLTDIVQYCDWIGYEEDTAYIFLMRDAFLPYVYYSSRNRRHIHPWLISRRFLEDITMTENADDDIRLPLYEALEIGHTEFADYCGYCRERILPVLDGHVRLKSVLLELLRSIPQKKIIAVESGYMGTIPMMLKALDDRVDFRLFTTAPFLYETYRERIFCDRYEDIRRFETVYAQDLLLKYSSFHSGKFYVHMSADRPVRNTAFSEIRRFL